MQGMKMTNQFARHEVAKHEIGKHKNHDLGGSIN